MSLENVGPVVWYVVSSINCTMGDRDAIRERIEFGYSSACATRRVMHRTNGVYDKAMDCGRRAGEAALADWFIVPPLAAWRAERAAWPTWRVLARYTEDGGYWSDDICAPDGHAAGEAARDIMVENGEHDRDGIEIVDCDLINDAERAKDHAAELVEALENFCTAYCPPDDGPLSWEACNDAYAEALAVLARVHGRIPESDQPSTTNA